VIMRFPEGPERNKALAVWGGLGGFGATAGLLVGGLLTASLGWESVFLINVPVVAVLVAVCPLLVDESRERGSLRSLDVGGALTVTGSLVLLVLAIVTAPEAGWGSARTIALLAGSVLLLALFVVVESRVGAPLVPLRLFRLRTLVGGNVVILAAGLALDGMLFPLMLYAQQVLHYSPLQAGLMTAVMTGMSIVGSFAGQAAVTRFGLRPVAVAGTLLVGAGNLLLTGVRPDGSFVTDVLPAMLVFGPGIGAAFVACQIAALAGVREEESGLAAGLVDTSFHLGNAVGIAISTSVAVSVAAAVHLAAPDVAPLVAQTAGLRTAFTVAVGTAALALIAALTLLPRRGAPV
jgi:MFS family permease